MTERLKLGLALGSGAARGWAHIGVLKALLDAGIKPDIVTGTSIGALVGAAYAAGNMPELERWLLSLSKLQTARFFTISSGFNGFVNRQRLHQFLSRYVASESMQISDLDPKFASVATHLKTGREVWNVKGSVLEAVWSSISLPGLFPAIKINQQWLIDGGLVNPVPISVCRALGADVVIAVNLNGDIVGKHFDRNLKQQVTADDDSLFNRLGDFVSQYTGKVFTNEANEDQPPDLFDAIAASVNITQDRITRSRMAGDPPEVLIQPRLSYIGLLEFYRAAEAIEQGYAAAQHTLDDIRRCLGQQSC